MHNLPQTAVAVNDLVTVTAPSGLELSLFPWEDPTAYVETIEAFLDESAPRGHPKPGLGLEVDDNELSRLWSGEPQLVPQHGFYHAHGCTCPRCTKAADCRVILHAGSVQAGAVAYRVQTPKDKEYMPVVNVRSEVITCNCKNGQHQYRATCYHAQAAWLEYTTDDTRRTVKRRAALAGQF